VGTSSVGTSSPRSVKRDFRALGRMQKDSGEQVVYSSVLAVTERDFGRNRQG